MTYFDSTIEQKLLEFVSNKVKSKYRFKIKDYQSGSMYVYTPTILNQIIKDGKFKDVGSIFDYPKFFSAPRLSTYDLSSNYESTYRIYISKKFKSVMLSIPYGHSCQCSFIVDSKKIKKFWKFVRPILQQDFTEINMFNDIDFKCKPGEYIEISKASGDDNKPVNIIKKNINNEKLVFDDKSTLKDVINDITSFFSEETEELYKKLDIPYKRGAILHGPPGTGKSALLREIIRIVKGNITKIVINPSISFNITQVLSSLLKSLGGKSSIIIIEDMDSLINHENRSEFLNLLDGIDVKSGSYIIGTTNYPERIDPAFVNRSGRFDRSFKIGNPSYRMRKMYFDSKKVNEIFDSKENLSDLFAKYTDGMPMASLKEIITTTKYTLVNNPKISIEEAIKLSTSKLKSDRSKHFESNMQYMKNKNDQRHLPVVTGNYNMVTGDYDNEYDGYKEPVVSEDNTNYIRIVKREDAEVEFSILQ